MKKMDEKWIKNQSKINQKWTKHRSTNRPKSRSGGILEASWRHLGASWGVLEAFWGVLGGLEPSWWRLESILKRPGGVLGSSWSRPGAVLATSWSVLGPLGASCGRLGSVLEVSCVWFSRQSGFNLGMLSWMSFCNWFLMDFASKNRCPNYEKSLNSIGKNWYFLLSGCFNIILFLDVILVSTWVHFRFQNPPKSWLGGLLGASWGVLEVSWDVL